MSEGIRTQLGRPTRSDPVFLPSLRRTARNGMFLWRRRLQGAELQSSAAWACCIAGSSAAWSALDAYRVNVELV